MLDGVPEAERKLCAYAAAVLPLVGAKPGWAFRSRTGAIALKRGASDAVRSRRLHSRFKPRIDRDDRYIPPVIETRKRDGFTITARSR